MAVQVEPAAIQVPASGGNVSLQLMNGNPEVVFIFSSNHLLFSLSQIILIIKIVLFSFLRSASPSSSSPAITSTTESTPSSDSRRRCPSRSDPPERPAKR
ncbi:unnamed protein product [Meloidogyne enterolobii]|uniref:Uncharacterized protein n=1 Tax=Meloidogyne enterolobii TaxID=390850 RepID=A0ACB0Z2P8_MELEN